jgi:hypothetical protein
MFTLTDVQKNDVVLSGIDSNGNDVDLTGRGLSITWSVDTSKATITPSTDTLSATIIPLPASTGVCHITASTVIDGVTISGSLDELITDPNAVILVGLKLTPSAPVAQ